MLRSLNQPLRLATYMFLATISSALRALHVVAVGPRIAPPPARGRPDASRSSAAARGPRSRPRGCRAPPRGAPACARGSSAKRRNSCTRSPYVTPSYSIGAKGPRQLATRREAAVGAGRRAPAPATRSSTTGCGVVIQSSPHVGIVQSGLPDPLADRHERVVAREGVVQVERPPHLPEAGVDVEIRAQRHPLEHTLLRRRRSRSRSAAARPCPPPGRGPRRSSPARARPPSCSTAQRSPRPKRSITSAR